MSTTTSFWQSCLCGDYREVCYKSDPGENETPFPSSCCLIRMRKGQGKQAAMEWVRPEDAIMHF